MTSKSHKVKFHTSRSDKSRDPSLGITSEPENPSKKHLQFSTIFKQGDSITHRPISPIQILSKSNDKTFIPYRLKSLSPVCLDNLEPKVEFSKYSNFPKTDRISTVQRFSNRFVELESKLRIKTKRRSIKEDFEKLEYIGYQPKSKTSFQFKGFLSKQSSPCVRLTDLCGQKQSVQVLKSENLIDAARKLDKREMTKVVQSCNRLAISPSTLDEVTYFKLLRKKLTESPVKYSPPNLAQPASKSKLDIASPKRGKELKKIHKIITSCDKLFHESRNMQDVNTSTNQN